MGGLVGIVRLDGGPVGRSIIDRWKREAQSKPAFRVRAGGTWASAFSPPPYQQAEGFAPQPFELASGQILFVEGRLDEPAALAASLGLDAGRRSDPALIAAAYDRWGPTAHERLYGDFAVALWDEGKRTLTLARDALGTRALYYHFDGKAVWFATALHLLLALPEVPRDLDELGLADFMTRSSDARERTLYKHIVRVPSGGSVSFREGSARAHRYWTLEAIRPVALPRDEDYAEMGRSLLDDAVKSRLPAAGLVATTLSGGLDSTAITATAARLLGSQRLTAFTRVAGAHDPYRAFDERALAGLVADRYSNLDWVVVDDLHEPDRNLNPEWESAAMGLPVTAQSISWFEPVERRAAAIGARVLLSGGWGNATLSWSGAGLCYEQVKRGRLVAAARDVARRARRQGKPVWPALRSDMISCLEPRALRRWRRGRKQPWQLMAVFAPDFLHSIDYETHTDSIGHDILRYVRRTGRELRWEMMRRELVSDRMAFLRNRTPHEKLNPFRDRRMAEFTLGTPERQFQSGGVDRWLARRTLADRLPAEILSKQGRGMQNGEWYHLASLQREQRAEAVERLGRSPLASRVLDVNFLKTLIDTWPRNAEEAMRSEGEHRHKLEFGLSVGAFLRWYEGSNG